MAGLIKELKMKINNNFPSLTTEMIEGTECSLFVDEFTGEKEVSFSLIAFKNSSGIDFLRLDTSDISNQIKLRILLKATPENIWIGFWLNTKEFPLKKGDDIIFLFEDKTTLKYTFISDGPDSVNIANIELSAVKKFAMTNIIKIRVSNNKTHENAVFSFKGYFGLRGFIKDSVIQESESQGQELFRYMTLLFIKTIAAEFPNSIYS